MHGRGAGFFPLPALGAKIKPLGAKIKPLGAKIKPPQDPKPTCPLEKTKTSAEPAAVSPQVRRVPSTDCSTGPCPGSMLSAAGAAA